MRRWIIPYSLIALAIQGFVVCLPDARAQSPLDEGSASLPASQDRRDGVRSVDEANEQVATLVQSGRLAEAKALVERTVSTYVDSGDGPFDIIGRFARLERLTTATGDETSRRALLAYARSAVKDRANADIPVCGIDLLAWGRLAKEAGDAESLTLIARIGRSTVDRHARGESAIALIHLDALLSLADLLGDDGLAEQVRKAEQPYLDVDGERCLDLAPFEILHLADRLEQVRNGPAKRKELVALIADEYLARTWLVSVVSKQSWLGLVNWAARNGGGQTLEALMRSIAAVAAERADWLRQLEPEELISLLSTVPDSERGQGVKGELLSVWLDEADDWSQASSAERSRLLTFAMSGPSGEPDAECGPHDEGMASPVGRDWSAAAVRVGAILMSRMGCREYAPAWRSAAADQLTQAAMGHCDCSEQRVELWRVARVMAMLNVQVQSDKASIVASAVAGWDDVSAQIRAVSS